MSTEQIRRLEHDSLEDELIAPAEALKPEERDMSRKEDARRAVGLKPGEEWLRPDNPAIWTDL